MHIGVEHVSLQVAIQPLGRRITKVRIVPVVPPLANLTSQRHVPAAAFVNDDVLDWVPKIPWTRDFSNVAPVFVESQIHVLRPLWPLRGLCARPLRYISNLPLSFIRLCSGGRLCRQQNRIDQRATEEQQNPKRLHSFPLKLLSTGWTRRYEGI